MTYRNIVKFINWLIKIANAIRMIQCKRNGECICAFCTNDKCRNRCVTISELIDPELSKKEIFNMEDSSNEGDFNKN